MLGPVDGSTSTPVTGLVDEELLEVVLSVTGTFEPAAGVLEDGEENEDVSVAGGVGGDEGAPV
jgi:hypothetical protein